jgi:hypothetical protein
LRFFTTVGCLILRFVIFINLNFSLLPNSFCENGSSNSARGDFPVAFDGEFHQEDQ